MKECIFIHFLGTRVVADEHHLDPLVVALQEQVQQDEEALRKILALFVHRAGYVHQAEHHRLTRRLRLLHAIHVTQIERIDKRNAPDASAQMVNFFLEHLDLFATVGRIGLHHLELLFEFVEFVDERRAERNAPAERAAQRAHDVDVVRRAFGGPARTDALPCRHREQMGFDEPGQFEIVEEVLHELVAAQLEHEVVLPFAFVAGAVSAAAPTSAAWARNLVTANVIRVAGVHHFALAAGAVPERWLGNVVARNGDALRVLDIFNATVAYRFGYGATNVVLYATQKAFAICNALVLASQPAVDDLVKHIRSPAPVFQVRETQVAHATSCPCGLRLARCPRRSAARAVRLPTHDDLRTRRYQSHRSRTCFGVYPFATIRLTKSSCLRCSSADPFALNEMTGKSSSVFENIFFSITTRNFS